MENKTLWPERRNFYIASPRMDNNEIARFIQEGDTKNICVESRSNFSEKKKTEIIFMEVKI